MVRPFTASSLRKFWWTWNPGYGYYLLQYCYRPLRRWLPSAVALLLTFVACGFLLHDVLYLVPLALRSGEIGFPFVTCWFAIIAAGLLIADALGLHFEPVPRLLRVPLHLGFLGATFWLTWRLSGLF